MAKHLLGNLLAGDTHLIKKSSDNGIFPLVDLSFASIIPLASHVWAERRSLFGSGSRPGRDVEYRLWVRFILFGCISAYRHIVPNTGLNMVVRWVWGKNT